MPGIDLVYYGNQRQLEYDFMNCAWGQSQAHPASICRSHEGSI
jgi:hypothetical protein